jgi:hypothetical protein
MTTADKGNTLVIIPTAQYHNKIKDFITNNKFQISNTDPTPLYQKQIWKTINNSRTLINKTHKGKFINLNPSAPTIKGLIKLHKADQPIRPVVNWRNAPAYKLAKLLSQKVHDLSPLPYTFNINNTADLIEQLKQTPITPYTRFTSLHISNMYANVPIKDTRQILDILEHNRTPPQNKIELLTWYDTVTQQNYFTHEQNIIIQNDGLAMGSPSSGVIFEIFLQQLEYSKLADIANDLQLINYLRYVDDILVIYDERITNINTITNSFDDMHPNLQFTYETEQNNKINYLDITIIRQNDQVDIVVYRKPTYTDSIIPYTSNHPAPHKYAAIRYMYN